MEFRSQNCQVVAVVSGSPYSSRNNYGATKKIPPDKSKFPHLGCCFWKILKSLILVLCLAFFFYQSVEFYHHYANYPLSLSIGIENPQRFKRPAVTICCRNPFPRQSFCRKYPEFCENPVFGFSLALCIEHNYHCDFNTSYIMIPKIGYFAEEASDELLKLLWESFLNYSESDMFPVRNILSKSGSPWTQVPSIVQDPFPYMSKNVAEGLYLKCVSLNLHLASQSEEEFEEISAEDGDRKKIAVLKISQNPGDGFITWKEEQMFIAFHSPFVPVNPVMDGIAVKHGEEYDFHIKLEEEHLQPHPYRTNCTDYHMEWVKKNRTGPRSQEMCKELCRLSFSRNCFGCETIRLTNLNPRNACLESFNHEKICTKKEEFEKLYRCTDHCKKACKNLKYRYSMTQTENNVRNSEDDEHVTVNLYVHTDVTIMTHSPLYGHWDIFSYIGGLIGCWMGISVWTLVGNLEKAFCMCVAAVHQMKSKSSSVSDE